VTISVIVVAHNEERHIVRCLRSIYSQDLEPDEVVVVAHNCTDGTERIVERRFPMARLVRFGGPAGTVYAHQKGFQLASCDVTAHIDADAHARDSRWLSELVAPLSDRSVSAVAGVAIYHGNWFVRFGSWMHFHVLYGRPNSFLRMIAPKLKRVVFWSSNFACRKSDYERVSGLALLINSRTEGDEWCEDFYLSLMLAKLGQIVIAPRSVVDIASKQQRVRDSVARLVRQQGVEHRLLKLAQRH
jgi:glycosyltransferase involved in cell wall biosynthesis